METRPQRSGASPPSRQAAVCSLHPIPAARRANLPRQSALPSRFNIREELRRFVRPAFVRTQIGDRLLQARLGRSGKRLSRPLLQYPPRQRRRSRGIVPPCRLRQDPPRTRVQTNRKHHRICHTNNVSQPSTPIFARLTKHALTQACRGKMPDVWHSNVLPFAHDTPSEWFHPHPGAKYARLASAESARCAQRAQKERAIAERCALYAIACAAACFIPPLRGFAFFGIPVFGAIACCDWLSATFEAYASGWWLIGMRRAPRGASQNRPPRASM